MYSLLAKRYSIFLLCASVFSLLVQIPIKSSCDLRHCCPCETLVGKTPFITSSKTISLINHLCVLEQSEVDTSGPNRYMKSQKKRTFHHKKLPFLSSPHFHRRLQQATASVLYSPLPLKVSQAAWVFQELPLLSAMVGKWKRWRLPPWQALFHLLPFSFL